MFANALTKTLIVAALALAATGCGSGDGLHKVTGKASYDGQPISEGRIIFRNTGGDHKAHSGAITNGQYEVMCEPGAMRVEITAMRVVPGKFQQGPGGEKERVPVTEMYIPTKYNTDSTLTAEVKSGSNDIPFELKK